MMVAMDVRAEVQKQAEALGWSTYRLANEVAARGHVSRDAVYRFMRGERAMTSDNLGEVLEVLGLRIEAKEQGDG